MKIDPYGGHVMTFRKLVIEDVRCFVGRQEFNIRPITFLVGENSTGKSTALGCFQTLDHFVNGIESALDFNKDPCCKACLKNGRRPTWSMQLRKPKHYAARNGIRHLEQYSKLEMT